MQAQGADGAKPPLQDDQNQTLVEQKTAASLEGGKPAAPLEVEQKPAASLEDGQKPAAPLEVEQKLAASLEDGQKPAALLEVEQKLAASLEDGQKPAAPLQDGSKPATPMEVEQKPATPVEQKLATPVENKASQPALAESSKPAVGSLKTPEPEKAQVIDPKNAGKTQNFGNLVAPVAANPPQDRTLEIAGIQALMDQQKAREAAAASTAVAPLAVETPQVTINWSTHRKEGMRLKRLMEESAEGAKYPHMMELWNKGSAESWLAQLGNFCFLCLLFFKVPLKPKTCHPGQKGTFEKVDHQRPECQCHRGRHCDDTICEREASRCQGTPHPAANAGSQDATGESESHSG